jgi:HPt (histidine-containing phosphotransfer) domain-containing protein
LIDSSGKKPTAAIDLERLHAQTAGDTTLERDVLALFLVQSKIDLDRIAGARTDADRRAVAHKLVGSARAVGAIAVASAAEAVERSAVDPAPAVAVLREALRAVHALIRARLDG